MTSVRNRTGVRVASQNGPGERLTWRVTGARRALPWADSGSRGVASRGGPGPHRGGGRRQPPADGRPHRPDLRWSRATPERCTPPRTRRSASDGGRRGQRPHRRSHRSGRSTGLRPRGPHRQLGLPDGDRHHRGGQRIVAGHPGGDPRAARAHRPVRRRRARSAAVGCARSRAVRGGRLGRPHGGDLPRRADRRRRRARSSSRSRSSSRAPPSS